MRSLFLFVLVCLSSITNAQVNELGIKPKLSWSIYKDSQLLFVDNNRRCCPYTLEIDLSEKFDSVKILLHNYDTKFPINRKLGFFCDSNEPVLELTDFQNRSLPFEIKKRTFRKTLSQCENKTGAIIYSDSLNENGGYVIFLKIRGK